MKEVNCKSRQEKMNWSTEPYFSLFSNNTSGLDSVFSIVGYAVLESKS